MLNIKNRREIELRLDALSKAPEYSIGRRKRVEKYLAFEASNNSVLMEQNEFSLDRLRTGNHSIRKNEKRKLRLKRERLERAWEYLIGLNDFFRDAELITLNRIVRGDSLDPTYRSSVIKVEGKDRGPFNLRNGTIENELQAQMSEFFYELNNPPISNFFVDQAIYAHLHLLRIHPFSDGNGRTSRLVQNSILYKNNCPPIIIHEAERRFYFDLLMDAYNGFKIEDHKPIERFFGYMGSKICTSLDRLMGVEITNPGFSKIK